MNSIQAANLAAFLPPDPSESADEHSARTGHEVVESITTPLWTCTHPGCNACSALWFSPVRDGGQADD